TAGDGLKNGEATSQTRSTLSTSSSDELAHRVMGDHQYRNYGLHCSHFRYRTHRSHLVGYTHIAAPIPTHSGLNTKNLLDHRASNRHHRYRPGSHSQPPAPQRKQSPSKSER